MMRGQENAVRVDVAVDQVLLVQIDQSLANAQHDLGDALELGHFGEFNLVQNVEQRADGHALEHEYDVLDVVGLAEAHQSEDFGKVVDASERVELVDEQVDVAAVGDVRVQPFDRYQVRVFPFHAFIDHEGAVVERRAVVVVD